MRYYAYLKQHGEGCDYTIGCGNTLITIDANSDEEAQEKLAEEIRESYYGDQELSDVKLFKESIPFDFGRVYSDMKSERAAEKTRLQNIKDREEFERLRKKLEGGE